jgi:beta-1,4-N-acetylglucosaminyltransferase
MVAGVACQYGVSDSATEREHATAGLEYPLSRRPSNHADVLLVCSCGGHLLQLVALRASWQGYTSAWVTFDKSDARSLLTHERVFYAYGPTNRSIRNLLRNLVVAWRVVRDVRPRVVITTGAGIAVPFAWVARLRGASVVYIESLSRIEGPSLSYRLIAPVAERRYVQWPELARRLRRSRFAGNVFSADA